VGEVLSLRFVLSAVAAGVLVSASPAYAGHGEADAEPPLNATHLSNVAQTGPTNSDLAFWGDHLYAGNYDGFKILDITDRAQPQTLVEYPCVSIQNDVGVWDTGPNHGSKRLLFTSVDASEPTDDCVDADGVRDPVSPLAPSGEESFEGLRIFDVTNPASPIYLKAVFTDCGSHTHSVVPVRQTGGSGDDRTFVLDSQNPDRVFVYVSSYPLASVLDETRCGVTNADGSVTHNKISIVEVPFDGPGSADVLKEVPLHPTTLGFPGQESQGCHDIGIFVELGLAAAACQGEGQIWDISDPANPDTMGAHRIFNEQINYFHSATLTWDGKYVIFGDEEGGAAITHACVNPGTGLGGTGSTWFYEREKLADSAPPNTQESGSYTQARQQITEGASICTAHNYNVIPVSDRYLLTSAYYEAGTSVLNFTDLDDVREIAYFDAAGGDVNPGATEANPKSDTWSSYWYRGNAFANDINRGVDIFSLTGPPATRVAGARTLDRLNPQTQECLILGAQDTGNDCTAPPPGGGAFGDTGGGDSATPCTTEIIGTKKSESLKGTNESERIAGKGGRDRINGRGGDDCLRGGGGRDRIMGSVGDDEIRPGRGKDRVRGGSGNDMISAARGGRDRIDCGRGDDVAVVNARKDRVARNCENVTKRSRRDFATAAHLQRH
jgi:hypothetical protein